jgi:predicted transcriptional regulator
MINKQSNLTREEFEESATQKLKKVIAKSKKIREHLRKLEKDVINKEEKIRNYQNIFSELEKQLVKIQTMLYAKGTT